MEIFGRKISIWWLLLVPPVLLLAMPASMMLFFMGNHLAGAIIGPPAIWNRPRHTPPRLDLVGNYSEVERHWDKPTTLSPAILTLSADGTMHVTNLPFESGDRVCILSGNGNWSGPDGEQKMDLNLISDGSINSCESGSYSSIELAGRSKPYSLYWVLGDPDSGTGIWLKKN